MITIDVAGGRGEGKTTTALRIVAALRAEGFEVEYRGATPELTEICERLLADGRHVPCLSAPRTVLVTDLGEPEVAPPPANPVPLRPIAAMPDRLRI